VDDRTTKGNQGHLPEEGEAMPRNIDVPSAGRAYKREKQREHYHKCKEKILARQKETRAARRAEHALEVRPPVDVVLLDKVTAVTEAVRYIHLRPNLDQYTKYQAILAAVAALDYGPDFWTPHALASLSIAQWVNKFLRAI